MDIKYIGKNIAKLRSTRGLTQEELGKRVGLTPSAISNIEKSTSYPSIDTLIKLAEFFGVTLDYLSTDTYSRRLDELHLKAKLLTTEIFLKTGNNRKDVFEVGNKKYFYEENDRELGYKVMKI